MADNPGLKVSVDDSDYSARLKNMINANVELTNSFRELIGLKSGINGLFDSLLNSAEDATNRLSKIADKIENSHKELNKGEGGSSTGSIITRNKTSNTINSERERISNIDETAKSFKKLSNEIGNLISGRMSSGLGGLVGSASGSKLLGQISSTTLNKLSSTLLNEKNKGKINSGLGNVASGASNSKLGEVSNSLENAASSSNKLNVSLVMTATKVLALVGAITAMSKAGQKGYENQLDLTRSLRQFGDSAGYAYDYAKKLNTELGTPMDNTLREMSGTVTELRKLGFGSKGATDMAVGTENLSNKLGLMYGIKPAEVYKQIQSDILSGSGELASYGAMLGDDVMAGWLQATKGLNMYATKVSESQMALYRYEKAMHDLNDVMAYQGSLTDSTFAKQLIMTNQLETMGKQLKALFIPVFQAVVSLASQIVDAIFKAVNFVRTNVFKMEPIKIETDLPERNEEAVEAIHKQNEGYKKQGEILKEMQNQKLPFDEWISLATMDQLKGDGDIPYGEGGNVGGTDGLNKKNSKLPVEAKIKVNDKDITEAIKKNDQSVIRTAIRVANPEELNKIWDKFDWTQKGQYGAELVTKFIQNGDLPKALEAMLFGTAGSLSGINAIQEFASGNPLGGIEESAQTILFWFGGWKGKLAFALMELNEIGWGSTGLGKIMGLASGILVMFGGWKGAIAGAALALVPLAAKLGTMLGQKANSGISKAVGGGSDNAWNKLQAWDSRQGTQNDQQYYANQIKKYGKDATVKSYGGDGYVKLNEVYDGKTLPTYAKGGIALKPHVAEIGHGPELVTPLQGPVADTFYDGMAQRMASLIGGGGAGGGNISVNVHAGNMIATNYELKQLSDIMADYLAESLRNRGVYNFGTQQ